ncbi:hypothetical protein [Companilactobacillus metriopterae]|uniref:hypothetical protein n=1 Tax=Companilactobacillus metriopterae TaxID=1909267 RepID=UPI00100A671A|nr:hypothetical protein [Companilactobacillus metriopterae]
MIRRFSFKGVFSTQSTVADLYILSGNTFAQNGRSLGTFTSWQSQEYAYDELTGYKYFKVDGTEWARLDKPGQNIVSDFDSSDGNYTVTVNRDFDYLGPNRQFTPYVVDRYQQLSSAKGLDVADGSSFVTKTGIEMYSGSTNSNGVGTKKFQTGFKVDSSYFYSMNHVFPNSKLTSSSGSLPGGNVTPITKIINVNSVAPDYFDYNGNAITGLHYNLGHQILSDGIYTTNGRTGYKIGNNQYININDATGTSLMYGQFFPTRKGVN